MTRTITRTTLLAGFAMVLAGCISGEAIDHEQAFQSCRHLVGTPDFSQCTENEYADARKARYDYAQAYQQNLDACESRMVEADALGAGQEQISCSKNAADYVLSGGPD